MEKKYQKISLPEGMINVMKELDFHRTLPSQIGNQI